MSEQVGSEFRRMILWQKAQDFAEEVVKLVTSLPKGRASDVVGQQLLRSVTSIPANIAEGYGRYSQAAYRNHLSMARGSAFETESWLDLLSRQGLLPAETQARLLGQCKDLQKVITLRMKSLGEARKTYAREDGIDYEV